MGLGGRVVDDRTVGGGESALHVPGPDLPSEVRCPGRGRRIGRALRMRCERAERAVAVVTSTTSTAGPRNCRVSATSAPAWIEATTTHRRRRSDVSWAGEAGSV